MCKCCQFCILLLCFGECGYDSDDTEVPPNHSTHKRGDKTFFDNKTGNIKNINDIKNMNDIENITKLYG